MNLISECRTIREKVISQRATVLSPARNSQRLMSRLLLAIGLLMILGSVESRSRPTRRAFEQL